MQSLIQNTVSALQTLSAYQNVLLFNKPVSARIYYVS